MDLVISLRDVTKKFRRHLVLDKINLDVRRGEIVGVLGGSGSGKSVLLKTIIGFLRPTNGNVFVKGKIGFSTQSNSLYDELTLRQNLLYFASLYDIKNVKEILPKLLNFLHLSEYENVLVEELSGGTKKRADIACAMLDSPEILILDEPFGGLDSFLVNELITFLNKIQKIGTTIVLSSHLLNQVENFATRFILVQNSTINEISKTKLKSLYSVV